MRRGLVVQFPVVTGDAELLDQSERSQQFRLAENSFPKNLFVEMIQVPRPEPDQIDQENRRRDHNRDNNAEKIFQDGLKHALTSPFPWLTVNQIFPTKTRASRSLPAANVIDASDKATDLG